MNNGNSSEYNVQILAAESEGEATARVVNMCLGGYPMPEDFATKEDAVRLLQSIWDVVDNWDGSGVNIEWARTGDTGHGVTVWEWARTSIEDLG